MILKDAYIQNFKGISEWHLEFRSGFNLIKGENGTGKTSILEALAVGLGGFVAGINDVATRHFSKEEIRKEYILSGDGSCSYQYCLPVTVSLSACLGEGQLISWTRDRASVQASRSTVRPRDIARCAEAMSNDAQQILPVLCYHGTGRVWAQKRAKSENIFKKYNRTVGYTDALLDASNNKMLLDWCVRMEQVGWQKGTRIAEYEAVKKAAADFMGYMEEADPGTVFYDKQSEELMARQGDTLLPVSCLSAGYQSLIWMVLDIACRMSLLNPFLRERITEAPGVVLIDELDMHLHPKWQWRVIDALKNTFPKIQFIATTHAPILFSSAKDVWLIDIEREQVEYTYSHYGLDLNTSVTHFQGDYDLPSPVKKSVDDFDDAMDQENYPAAKQILDQLTAATAPEFPMIAGLRARYEIETGLKGI